MKKIPSVFVRNYDGDRLVRDEVVPGCEWVIAGEGIATRKWDGTACLVRGGKLYRRYDAKHGKTPPPGFDPAQDPDPFFCNGCKGQFAVDAATGGAARNGKNVCPSCGSRNVTGGHWPGWLLVGDKPEDKPFADAWALWLSQVHYPEDGTYELCGPKFQSNPEQFAAPMFLRHGAEVLPDVPRTFAGLRDYLGEWAIEGVVFHRRDGRMAKVKRPDFGFAWNASPGRIAQPITPITLDAIVTAIAAGRKP